MTAQTVAAFAAIDKALASGGVTGNRAMAGTPRE